ncbi:Ubiquitin carboxyl-terminal hydrolase [Paragonimus heterotremus]|uniref:Ubiquitin carboxyl-terminal hydrolase n=1 Tax=Paragonimus heterotremus TaxID=100268 RepID=A0A8J4SKU1_9TREM|nr:Ubiquitin carboxyl-terminal hydrolase [Paragonimus heterotremus]
MRWIPLEANPEVMNQFIYNLGVKPNWEFVDVYGLDPELLSMVPRPVLAVILLYPLSDSNTDSLGKPVESSDVFLVKQTIDNACGTIALLHAVMNNENVLQFKDGSLVGDLLHRMRDTKPADRGPMIEKENRLSDLHESSAVRGQTTAPAPSIRTNLHFICFVENSGALYELDGRKDLPILHGPTSPDTLLEDTAVVIKKFMAQDPQSINYAVVALCRKH